MSLKERLWEIAGKENVLSDSKELGPYSRDYSPAKPMMPDYVVKPETTEQIAALVAMANQTGTPLIPSSSTVHFYGATLPKYGGIILDLRKMNHVLGIDERNRMVRIQPGVTWKQLSPELEKKGLFAVSPLLPHPGRSVLTTYLEREPLTIPRYEFGDPLLGTEVIWPNGEVFRTGSASVPGFPNSFAQGANPQGPGCMDFYRLFQGAQGTMGIVTWANIKVEYLPVINKAFFIPFSNLEEVPPVLYKIGKLRIGYEYFLANSLNWTILFGEDGAEGIGALKQGLPGYILAVILSGIRRHPEEKVAYEEKALNKMMSVEFNHLEKLGFAPGFPGLESKLPHILRHPFSEDKVYWKLKYKGALQELFFITAMERAPFLLRLAREEAARRGYPVEDLGIYVQPIEYGVGCHCQLDFYYNPQEAGRKEQILKIHDAVAEALLNQGAHFTRPYGNLARMVYSRTSEYTEMLKRIKNLFDPNNILCPGNLCY